MARRTTPGVMPRTGAVTGGFGGLCRPNRDTQMRITILFVLLSTGCATPTALLVNRTHATPADGEAAASFADADVKHQGVPVFLAKNGGAHADYLNKELQARLGEPTSDATKLQTTMTIEELFVPKPVVVVTLK